MVIIDNDLKDMIISAFRYALGRHTYITLSTCEYIQEHSGIIDERVKKVLLRDLEQLNMYYPNGGTDYDIFISFKRWLENFEVEETDERKEETITELEQERVPYTNEYVEKLEKENEELKSQLEEANKKLYLCTPEIPQNVHEEYVSYVDLVNEVYELKKQLEERSKDYCNASNIKHNYAKKLVIIQNQQQEFIKYLEKERERCLTFYCRTECAYAYDVFIDILQKYKEIIGVSDEH